MPGIDLDVLRRTPAYPFAEAAHYLRVPKGTLRAWFCGHARFKPVIALDGQRPRDGLSFINLVEAHVLASIRRVHGVSLPTVRKSLEYVEQHLEVSRPFAAAQFQTDGVHLFVEHLGELLNVAKEGQIEMQALMRAHLKRVERDPRGVPIKLYPFTRKDVAGDAPAPVAMDPRIAFGRPVLAGSGVPTAVLADRFKAGDTLSDLAADYATSTEAIEEALRCELDRAA